MLDVYESVDAFHPDTMKLRVRLGKQTSRLELEGDQPTLTELTLKIKEIILPACGISLDTDFTLSLNGKEPLSDTGQTLASCGLVSGDLICVLLPQSCPTPSPNTPTTSPSCPSSTPRTPTSFQATNTITTSKAAHRMQEPSPSTSTASPHKAEAVASSSQASLCSPSAEAGVEVDEELEEAASGPFIADPMLCNEAEEGKVPHSLQLLHQGAQSHSSNDCLMVALHLIMLETGFQPQESDRRTGEMPVGWRAPGGMYRLQYTHPLCENSLAVIVSVPMGSMLVLNATLKMNGTVENARKLELRASSYVADDWEGEKAADVYKDLRKLSRVFKDQLVYPLMASARQAMGLPLLFGLPVLPPELLVRVLRLLDVASVVALSSVSRGLRVATEDPSLWRHLYHRDFRTLSTQRSDSRDTDWKELYQKRYKQRKEMIRARPRAFPFIGPPIHPLHPLPAPPLPLYPPGIIGGEYDQRPGVPHGLLPRPRFDPIGPLHGQDPGFGMPIGRRPMRQMGSRSADIRRGFI